MQQLLEWTALLLIPAFLVLDLVHSARSAPLRRWWRLRALAVSVLTYFVTLWVGQLWGAHLPAWSVFDGSQLGTWGGGIVGVLVYELAHYAYHRAAHRFDWLWRAGHQLHHSAERLDSFGANYLHPLDAALFTTWAVLVFFPLLGLAPEAAALANVFLVFNAMFQHADLATPRWLGFLIQRPEAHAIHHQRGRHADNYSDLPLWDWAFGTLRNPRRGEAEALEQGFYDGASERLVEMIAFRDVSQPKATLRAPRIGRDKRGARAA